MSFGTERRLSRPVRRVALVLFVVAWLLVAVAALAEVFLVGYAERRAAGSLNGAAIEVKIEARPAVKLVFGRADEVVLRAGRITPAAEREDDGDSLGDLLAGTKAATRIDATASARSSPPA